MEKILLAILLMSVNLLHAQKKSFNAYYDAVALKEMIHTNDDGGYTFDPKSDAMIIIRSYYPAYNSSITDKTIAQEISDPSLNSYNPFINELLSEIETMGDASKKSQGANRGLPSSIGGINVTNLADGLTQHIISNAKEELNIAFFRKFRNFSKDNPEFRTLFPETAKVLEGLIEYQYNIMLSVLQDAFIQDANNLIYQLDELLELPRLRPVRDKFPELLIVIEVLQVADQLENDVNAADILAKLNNLDTWNKDWETLHSSTQQFYQIIALGNIVSMSVRSKEKDTTIWINKSEFKVLLDDPVVSQIFVGLVYQNIRNAANDKEGTKILDETIKTIAKTQSDKVVKLLVEEFYSLSEELSVIRKEIKKLKDSKKKPTSDQIYSYIDISLRTLDYGGTVVSKIRPELKSGEGLIDILHDANSAYRAVYQKNYTVSVHYSAKVLQSTLSIIQMSNGNKNKLEKLLEKTYMEEPDFNKLRSEASKIKIDISNITNLDDLGNTLKASISIIRAKSIVDEGSKYLQLIALLADANSAEEAKSAIAAVALPAGSSSLKKHQKFNINVASYLGVGYRMNEVEEVNRSWDKQWFVSMPIGIGFNVGLGRGGSMSLNLNVFDLGAIAAFRLNEDSVGNKSIDEQIVLSNIFSPGIMINYGFFADLPLSLAVGAQLGPGLRSIDDSDGVTFNKIYGTEVRYVVTLAIDVPLLNIFNGQTRDKRR